MASSSSESVHPIRYPGVVSRASANFAILVVVRSSLSFSTVQMDALDLFPILMASSCWLMPSSFLRFLILSPIVIFHTSLYGFSRVRLF